MKIYVNNFKGMAPKIPSRLKHDNFADFTSNTDTSTGDILPFAHYDGTFSLPSQVPSAAKCFFKWRFKDKDYWWGSTQYDRVNAVFISIPDVSTDRQQCYWMPDGDTMHVCEGADMLTQVGTIQGDSVIAGIPQPQGMTMEVTGSPQAGTIPTSHSYVITFARNWADGIVDEGPASANVTTSTGASVVDVYPGQSVVIKDISGMNAFGNDGTQQIRVYRSETTSTGTARYYLAATAIYPEATPPSTKYTIIDNMLTTGPALTDMNNYAIPGGAHSFIALANGYYAAAKDSTIYVSNYNRPYAYPRKYSVTISESVVGLGSFGNTIVACTNSEPVLITVSDPANPIVKAMQDPLPCLSKHSIVSTSQGVMYACPTGVALISSDTPKIITSQLFSERDWDKLNPADMQFAYIGKTLYIFSRSSTQILYTLDFSEYAYNSLYNQLTSPGLTNHTTSNPNVVNTWWDPNARRLYVKYTNSSSVSVYTTDVTSTKPGMWSWTSRTFVSAQGAWRPVAAKVNQEGNCTLTVYLDGKTIFSKLITGSKVVKLPAGYTGTELQFKLDMAASSADNTVHSVTIASSMVECLEGAESK